MPLLFGEYRRFVIFGVCIIEMIFMSGIHYGWNSLVGVWMAEGLFADGCVANSSTPDGYEPITDNSTDGLTVKVTKSPSTNGCTRQVLMMQIAFIVSSNFQFLVTLPCGIFFDRYGIRFSKLCNLFFFVSASIMMALASPRRAFLLFPAGILYSFAGAFIIFTNFPIGMLFPTYQSLVISIFSGGFDSSSIVFQLIKFGYDSGISLMVSFLTLAGVGTVVMLFIAFFLFPKKTITDQEDSKERVKEVELHEPEEKVAEEEEGDEKDESARLNANGTEGGEGFENPVHQEEQVIPKLSECIRTRDFWLQVMWFTCMLLRFVYFLSALQPQLGFRFGSDQAPKNRLNTTLGFFLFCGILFAPLAGAITEFLKRRLGRAGENDMQKTLRAIGVGQMICSTFALLLTVLIFVPEEPVFYVIFLLEVLVRAFLFSLNGAFFLTAFPPAYFGKLLGLCFLLSGIFSFIQFALLELDLLWSNGIVLLFILISYLQPLNLLVGPRFCCR